MPVKPSGFVGVEELTHTGNVLSLEAHLIRGREKIEVTPIGEAPILIKVPTGEKITAFYPSVEGDTMIVTTEGNGKETTRFYDNRTGEELTKETLGDRPVHVYQ